VSAREDRALELWDYAVSKPDGFTADECEKALKWEHAIFNIAVHDLRSFLGDTDTVALPCDPQGQGEQWLYHLTGTLDETSGWVTNRIGDAETRIRTIQATMRSIVRATSKATTKGRKARKIEKGLRHLIEDLEDIEA